MSGIPAPPPPSRPGLHTGRLLLGLLVAAFGALWLLDASGVTGIDWDLVLPIGVIAVGVALVIVGAVGRGSGGLVVLGTVLTALLLVSTVVTVPLSGGVGERTYRPPLIRDRTYELAVGEVTIDLTRSPLPAPTPSSPTVTAHVGIGHLLVIVPPRFTPVDASAKAGIGEVVVFGRERGGLGVEYRTPGDEQATAALRLELSVGIGQVEVRRG